MAATTTASSSSSPDPLGSPPPPYSWAATTSNPGKAPVRFVKSMLDLPISPSAEVDPVCLLGRDMSSVKAVVLCGHARLVARDVWPKRGPWGTRVVRVEVGEVWSLEERLVNGEYRRYFNNSPPPPFRHIIPMYHGVPAVRDAAAGGSPRSVQGGAGHGRQLGQLLLLAPDSPPSLLAPPPSPTDTSEESGTVSASPSDIWSSSATSSLTSADSSPGRRTSTVVITEIVELPASTVLPPPPDEDKEEDDWTTVIGSAHQRRKARGKAKKFGDAERRSDRLAKLVPVIFEDMTTKAVKRAELRDTLRSCSVGLQNQVVKCQVLNKKSAPLGMKSVSEIRTAAFGHSKQGMKKTVPKGADD